MVEKDRELRLKMEECRKRIIRKEEKKKKLRGGLTGVGGGCCQTWRRFPEKMESRGGEKSKERRIEERNEGV